MGGRRKLWSALVLLWAGCSPGRESEPVSGIEEAARAKIPAAPTLGFASERRIWRARQAGLAGASARSAPAMTPAYEVLASDAQWFEEAAAVPLGAKTRAHSGWAGAGTAQIWHNIGFVPDASGALERRADLLGELPALASTLADEPAGVDCVAVISIDRHGEEEPYLYRTLRSFFAGSPPGLHVNVLVGNDDLDYVSPARLTAALGEAWAGQVHVHPTSPATTAYLRAQLPPYRRGGWNYARALRGYRGTRGLLVMEDDVLWARGGMAALAAWRQEPAPLALSLFNHHCAQLSGEREHTRAAFRVNTVAGRQHTFMNLQAMVYSPAIADSVGRYMQLRMHKEIYDRVVGWYFTLHSVTIGYAFPSIAQHIGLASAAKGHGYTWGFHQSSYYRESF